MLSKILTGMQEGLKARTMQPQIKKNRKAILREYRFGAITHGYWTDSMTRSIRGARETEAGRENVERPHANSVTMQRWFDEKPHEQPFSGVRYHVESGKKH